MLLEGQLAALIDEDRLAEQERKPVALDQEAVGRLTRIDAMQVQAMAQAQARRRAGLRTRIRAALERIAQGDFGAPALNAGRRLPRSGSNMIPA